MNIQKADIKDFEKIKVISDEIRAIHIKGRPDLFENHMVFNIEYFKTFFDENICYVVKENNNILGFILLKVKITEEDSHMKQRKILFIDELGVKNEYRNKGIGSVLLNKAEEYAKEIKANVIDFKVFDFNINATKFYNKHGYKVKSFDMEKWI